MIEIGTIPNMIVVHNLRVCPDLNVKVAHISKIHARASTFHMYVGFGCNFTQLIFISHRFIMTIKLGYISNVTVTMDT